MEILGAECLSEIVITYNHSGFDGYGYGYGYGVSFLEKISVYILS